MSQASCRNCEGPLSPEDIFCVRCGSQRADTETPYAPPPPGPALSVIQQPVAPVGYAQVAPLMGFFSHETTVPRDAGRWTNATRYLCAGAYLDSGFANKVIGELIASHRAVAPSRGINLDPIIRHCLKARRLKLIRDIALSVLLLVGLVTATIPLFFILAITFFCGYLPGARWERRSLGGRALAGLAAIAALVIVGGILTVGIVVVVVLVIAAKVSSSGGGGTGTSLPLSGFFSAGLLALWSLVYAVLLIGTLVRYFWLRDKTLVEWLRPGATAPAFRQESPRVENRIAEVCRAQYGNLTLYDTQDQDPFLGTGWVPYPFELFGKDRQDDGSPVWSIAIELNRAGAPRGLLGFNARDRVCIDPVDLHRVLRARLEQLNDPRLPTSQRVAYLTVADHVVGEGRFDWDSPLIDRQRMIPYSQANQEAVEALIRAPQGRLRYYQRVSISDEGLPVETEDGRPVIGSVDQEIIASAFVYIAVEGHMFYLQFFPKVLPRVDRRFRDIDTLPRSSSTRFLGRVLLDALRGSFHDIITAPYNVYKALRLSFREWRNFTDGERAEADFAYADVGARIGVREYGSQGTLGSYLEALDTDKYTQIVERLVLETVLDYLVAQGADTAVYRASAASIINGDVYSGNTGSWSVNTGAGTQNIGNQPERGNDDA
jgi:hypothetical protein